MRCVSLPSWLAVVAIASISLFTGFTAGAPGSSADPDLPALLAQYREFGLPLPPNDAVLVKGHPPLSVGPNGVNPPVMYYLAFRIPSTGNGPSRLFWGTESFPEDVRPNTTWEPTTPDQVRVAALVKSSPQPFRIDEPLALALQCESLGWHDLATSFSMIPPAVPSRRYPVPLTDVSAGLSLEQRLHHLAWAHWCNVFRDRDSNRQAIREHLETLFKIEPSIRSNSSKAQFLDSLTLALKPSAAIPGSIEADIDGLCEVAGHPHYWNQPGPKGVWTDPGFIFLAEKGFAAVPALLKHMDDPRLTRCLLSGSMLSPHYHSVGDLSRMMIVNIAGMPLDRDPDDRRAMEKWWAATQNEDEASYMASHVFPEQPEGKWRIACRLMLTILAKRHPETLPKIFQIMVKAGQSQIRPDQFHPEQRPAIRNTMMAGYANIPQIIGEGLSSRDMKIELFLRAAQDPASQLCEPAKDQLKLFSPDDIARVRANLSKGGS